MILCCGCLCGSTDTRIRGFLKSVGYSEWATISIPKGKEKSRKMIQSLPKSPELQDLDNYLSKVSKWAIILGWDNGECKWADLAHSVTKAKIEAEYIVKNFS